MKSISKLLIAITLILALFFAGCSSQNSADLKKSNSTDSSVQIQKEDGAKSEAQISQEKLTQIIADGTYSEPINYQSPGGSNDFVLNMVIKDNIVSSISLDVIKADDISKSKILNTNKELQTLLVGKSLSEVKIPVVIVSGASLTSKAVNDKLNQLESK